jgi:hypothetical protein
MGIVRISYEIITEESAREGDVAERGWEDEEGTEYTTHDLIKLLEQEGCEPSSTHFHMGIWYTSYGEADIFSGDTKNISYHLSGFSEDEEKEIFQSISRW